MARKRTIKVCTRCLAIVVDDVPPVLRCTTAEGDASSHQLERVGPPTVAEALAVLSSFVDDCEDWKAEREAWKLAANRSDAARDLAALFTWAPREKALQLAYFDSDPSRPRPEWTGETSGDDSENRIARRGLIERFMVRVGTKDPRK